MKKDNHPKLTFALSPINGIDRQGHAYLKADKGRSKAQVAEIYTERMDGVEEQLITPITRKDAIAIVKALYELFDLTTDEQIAIGLLDAKMQRIDSFAENMAHVAIANVMYENGIRRAVLTPSRIMAGMVPKYTIETAPDQLVYLLDEDPLNERT